MRLSQTSRRWLRAGLAMLASVLLGLGQLALAQSALPREAQIKAVLITRLVKFVEWPGYSRANAEPLQICTWGESSTSTSLQALQGQIVREREIRVRKLTPQAAGQDTRGCHVLYVAESMRDITPALLYSSGSRALLTVSDMPEFNKRGGIISLVRQDNRIGFEIHLRYARESGLQIGAPLLELARVVD